jgi:hypothetical protein
VAVVSQFQIWPSATGRASYMLSGKQEVGWARMFGWVRF